MDYIEVKGLFGDRNVKFSFKKPLLILIGENGIGKSTVLAIINSILNKDIEVLKNINFEIINFYLNDEMICLKRSELYDFVEIEELSYRIINNKRLIIDLQQDLEISEKEIINNIQTNGLNWVFKSINDKLVGKRTPALNYIRRKYNFEYEEMSKKNPHIDNFFNKIIKYFEGEILYFPTYRRVEEEANKFNIEISKTTEANPGKDPIKFGMQDVQEIFKNITELIRQQTVNGVQEVMDNLFTELVTDRNLETESSKNKLIKNRDDLEIILQRSQESLPFSLNETLGKIDLILKKQILTDKEQFVIYFISKYLKIYEASKIYDEKINHFIQVCNSYFEDKYFIYDLKEIQIKLISKFDSSRIIELKSLSSGEKQIVSLFAKLYLSDADKFIILFDEPELSLSIKWQEKLLTNILDTKKCEFMMAVTHSPFIISEETKKYTLSFGSTMTRIEDN